MKKLIILAAMTIVLMVLCIRTSSSKAEDSLLQYKIDCKEKITIDFKNAKVRITGWDNEFIQVNCDDYITSTDVPVNIKQDGNILTLEDYKKPIFNKFLYKNNTWFAVQQIEQYKPFSDRMETGLYDFEIKVPMNTPIEVNADILKTYNCYVQAVYSSNAEIRDCDLADHFIGSGKSIEVRETDIGENAYFANRKLKLRECDAKSIVIGVEKATGILDAEIRELTGTSVALEASDYNDMSLLIRDSSFDSFTVNSTKDTGDIQLRSSKISNIINNSNIDIVEGDWNGWRY